MQDLNDKITNDTLTADEWNEIPSEIQNVIESQGIVLSGGDLNQLGKSLAGYISNGHFYSDSGAANAYVLSVVGSRQDPPALVDGFQASFLTANPNTAASTVNASGLGVKSIKIQGGNDPAANDISGRVELSYDLSNNWFELKNPKVTNQTITKATIAAAKADDSLVDYVGGYVTIINNDYGIEINTNYKVFAGLSASPDGVVWNSDTASLFYLQLENDGPVNLGAFNVNPDGVTDNFQAITDCQDFAGSIFVPAGRFFVGSSTVFLVSNKTWQGEGGQTSVFVRDGTLPGGSRGIFTNNDTAAPNVENITFLDIGFDGQVATESFSEFKHLFSASGVTDLTIERCRFEGFQGDGLYIGSGTVGGDEMHNYNVTVRDCVFDGVNSDNRNGITVIDGDGVHILNNTFRSCTRSNMPGPIDVEPDANAFHIVRNINIIGNHIRSYGGAHGIVVDLNQGPYTLPGRDIRIINNTITGSTYTSSIIIKVKTNETITSTTEDMGFVVKDNYCDGAGSTLTPFVFDGISGLRVIDNVFNSGTTAELGDLTVSDLTIKNALFRGNTFWKNGNASGSLLTQTIEDVTFEDNLFYDTRNAAATQIILIGDPSISSASDTIKFTNNTFVKVQAALNWSVREGAAHVSTPTSNRFSNNTERDFVNPAAFQYRADSDNYSILDGFTYDTTKLPDSFVAGVHTTIINGDAGAPDANKQGVIITTKMSSSVSFRKFTQQLYYPAGNSPATEVQIWKRTGADGSDTWLTWRLWTGV